MPDLPAFHGWTHRPKELGGTDPIPLPGLTYAFMGGGTNNVTTATGFDVNEPYPWTSYESNDTAENVFADFTDDNTDKGVEVKQAGVYYIEWSCKVTWKTIGTNPTKLIPPAIHLPLKETTGTEFSTSSFSIHSGPAANWLSNGEFPLDGTGAKQWLYLGASYMRTPLGPDEVPLRITALIRSEGGLHDWEHSSGQFFVVRIGAAAA